MDAFVFEKINQLAFRNIWLDNLGVFLAEILPFILAIFLIALLLINFKKYKEMVGLSFLAAGLSRLFSAIIRLIFPRSRPFEQIAGARIDSLLEDKVNLLVEEVNASSFPSAQPWMCPALSQRGPKLHCRTSPQGCRRKLLPPHLLYAR